MTTIQRKCREGLWKNGTSCRWQGVADVEYPVRVDGSRARAGFAAVMTQPVPIRSSPETAKGRDGTATATWQAAALGSPGGDWAVAEGQGR
jgi:hypothetical protein